MQSSNTPQPKDEYKVPSIINIAIVILVLAVIGIASVILAKPTVSEVEKRELTPMPTFEIRTVFAGKYAKQLEMHYADTFPAREFFVSFASLLDESKGLRFDDVRIHGESPLKPQPPTSSAPIVPTDNSSSSDTSSSTPSSTEVLAPSSSEVLSSSSSQASSKATDVGEKQGSTFIYKGRGMAMFGGSQSMGKWYADTINAYQKALAGSGVQIYDIVIPTSIEFYLPDKYKDVTMPQKPNIDYIYSQLAPEVKGVDAYSALMEHKDEYIYFNTDHHWTVMGAYYAYTEFAKAAGIEPTPITSFEKRTIPNFLGTLYGQTQDSSLKENKDYVDYYMPRKQHTAYRFVKDQPFTAYQNTVMGEYASGGVAYSVFLHGDHPLIRIDTENKNGRKAMVIKESYGNAFAPFLIDNFEQVYVVDQRYFQLGIIDYIKQNGITDLVFINNIFAANTAYHIEKIGGMMYQQWTPPPPPPPVASESSSSSEASSDTSSSEEAPVNGDDENSDN